MALDLIACRDGDVIPYSMAIADLAQELALKAGSERIYLLLRGLAQPVSPLLAQSPLKEFIV